MKTHLHRSLLLLGFTLATGALIAQPDAGPGGEGAPRRGHSPGPGGADHQGGPRGTGEHPPGGPGRELQRRLREKFDADKDGKLNPEEAKLARQEFRRINEERHAKMLEKFDADKNGTLEGEELVAARKAWMNQLDEAKDNTRKKFDTNGNGILDESEKAAAEAGMREKWQQRRAAILKRFDTNGDGELSEEEKSAARKEMPRRNGPPHDKPGENEGKTPECPGCPGENPPPGPRRDPQIE